MPGDKDSIIMIHISKEHLLLFILRYSASVFLGGRENDDSRVDTEKNLTMGSVQMCVWESTLHPLRGQKYVSRSLSVLGFVLAPHGIVHHAFMSMHWNRRNFLIGG